MTIYSGSTEISKMYVGSTLVSAAYANSASLLFNPSSLFSASEQGAWYDPSDWTTLFQDAAGTTPVTAVGQPVGLMLDKRLGLVRGPELCTDPTMSTPALWQFSGTAPLWGVSGGKGEITATSTGNRWLQNGIPLTIGKTYEITADVVVSAGSVAPDIGGSELDVTTSGSKRWITTAATATLQFIGRAAFIGSIDNISVKELPGNHATQTTAINRPVLQIDGNGKHYLAFNGTNSWMSTPAINFTTTDKMTVVAGVRKLSDAVAGMLLELSPNINSSINCFYLLAPDSAGAASYAFGIRGSSSASARILTSFASPISSVLSANLDKGAASISLCITPQVNGVTPTIANNGGASAAGNFGNYPLYIGARAGTQFCFNGNLYGLIVRGALSTASQITGAENFMNVKTGAY